MGFDIYLFNFIFQFVHKSQILDLLGIFLASYLAYILVVIAVVLILKEKNWRRRIYFFSLTALSLLFSRGIITEVIRFFYHRQRPFDILQIVSLISHDAEGSFPSGHATFFFALALAIFYLNKRWGIRFLVAALLMAVARIYVGVHWPTDIIAGALIGLASVIFIKIILPKPAETQNIES